MGRSFWRRSAFGRAAAVLACAATVALGSAARAELPADGSSRAFVLARELLGSREPTQALSRVTGRPVRADIWNPEGSPR